MTWATPKNCIEVNWLFLCKILLLLQADLSKYEKLFVHLHNYELRMEWDNQWAISIVSSRNLNAEAQAEVNEAIKATKNYAIDSIEAIYKTYKMMRISLPSSKGKHAITHRSDWQNRARIHENKPKLNSHVGILAISAICLEFFLSQLEVFFLTSWICVGFILHPLRCETHNWLCVRCANCLMHITISTELHKNAFYVVESLFQL